MKIRLLTGRVGTDFTQDPGEIIDVPQAEAQRMIDAWQAEEVDDEDEETKPAGKSAAKRR